MHTAKLAPHQSILNSLMKKIREGVEIRVNEEQSERETAYWKRVFDGSDGSRFLGFDEKNPDGIKLFLLEKYGRIYEWIWCFKERMNFLNPEDRAIEIGAGPGTGLIFSLTRGTLFALDPLMDKYIELNSKLKDWKGTLINGLGEDLSQFTDKSFKFVCAFNSLDHCSDPEVVLREMHRILQDDGMIAISTQLLKVKNSLHPWQLTAEWYRSICEELGLEFHNISSYIHNYGDKKERVFFNYLKITRKVIERNIVEGKI